MVVPSLFFEIHAPSYAQEGIVVGSSKLIQSEVNGPSDNNQAVSNGNDWLNVSGLWELNKVGLHGGGFSNDSIGAENNLILSPSKPDQISDLSTSFRINNLDGNVSNYVALVYSYLDPMNYKYAGINLLNNSVYAIFYNVSDGLITADPTWPGFKTNLTFVPDTLFNLGVRADNSSKHIIINGSDIYSQKSEDSLLNGSIGLFYGRVSDIDFYNFKSGNNIESSLYPMPSSNPTSHTVGDSQTILLAGKSLPSGSYIPLYDSYPYRISSGHIAAKLPCNDENEPSVNVVTGVSPELFPIDLEFITQLSSSGDMCLYHGDISSSSQSISDIAVQNNSPDDIEFPTTSSLVIHVDKISKSNVEDNT